MRGQEIAATWQYNRRRNGCAERPPGPQSAESIEGRQRNAVNLSIQSPEGYGAGEGLQHRNGSAPGVGQLAVAWAIGMAFSLPFDAAAGSLDLVRTADAEGRFIEVARIAEGFGTPVGFMLAARSLRVHGHLNVPTDRAERYLGHAIDLAAKAVSTGPDNVEAHVRLATVIGRHAEAIGSFVASNRGYGTRTREAAEMTLALAPEMADARLAMGRWHACDRL